MSNQSKRSASAAKRRDSWEPQTLRGVLVDSPVLRHTAGGKPITLAKVRSGRGPTTQVFAMGDRAAELAQHKRGDHVDLSGHERQASEGRRRARQFVVRDEADSSQPRSDAREESTWLDYAAGRRPSGRPGMSM